MLQTLPRFQPENLEHNNRLYERVKDMATRKGCTPSQLALAWLYHQGDDVCPIPGTTKINNLNQNIGALAVKLTSEDLAELDSIASSVKGDRYQSLIDTWLHVETPPLSSWKVWIGYDFILWIKNALARWTLYNKQGLGSEWVSKYSVILCCYHDDNCNNFVLFGKIVCDQLNTVKPL